MLNEIIIGVLVIVVLFEAIMVSAISQRCKESKRELKKKVLFLELQEHLD